MATQNCPRCKGNRIRHGYRPTPFFRRLIFRYNLLCNDCNWEFVGFAIPGTVSSKVKRKKKSEQINKSEQIVESNPRSENLQPKITKNFENQLPTLKEMKNELVAPKKIVSEIEIAPRSEIPETIETENIQTVQTVRKKTKVRKRVKIKLT